MLIDKTLPGVTGVADRMPDSNGWYNHPLNITWTGSDSLAGVASCNPPSSYSGPKEGLIALTGHCADKAGNTGVGTFAFKFDITNPKITSSPQFANYTLNAQVFPQFQYTDATSGISTCTVSAASVMPCSSFLSARLDTAAVGTHTYTIIATDNAGNSATLVVSYNAQYKFGGFLSPISRTHFADGSTVSIKFQLFDTSSIPEGTAAAKIFVDDQPGVASGTSNTGNLFRYDPVTQQYVFNLSTKGVPTGLHTITIKLDDGTTHSITIRLV